MSTRGAIGFRIDNKDYVTYNHSDSYPEGLGTEFVTQVRELMQRANLPAEVRALRLVSEDTPPTPEDVERLSPLANTSVSKQTKQEWYCLLRNAQGDLRKYLEAGVIIDGADFLADSLFCEFAYILNLDTMEAEFYRGFNRSKRAKGRYAKLQNEEGGYYGVKLVGKAPANAIPEDWQAQFYPEEVEA